MEMGNIQKIKRKEKENGGNGEWREWARTYLALCTSVCTES